MKQQENLSVTELLEEVSNYLQVCEKEVEEAKSSSSIINDNYMSAHLKLCRANLNQALKRYAKPSLEESLNDLRDCLDNVDINTGYLVISSPDKEISQDIEKELYYQLFKSKKILNFIIGKLDKIL